LFTSKQNVNVMMDAALDQFVCITASQLHSWGKTESGCEQRAYSIYNRQF
jgi:hypothetical protein